MAALPSTTVARSHEWRPALSWADGREGRCTSVGRDGWIRVPVGDDAARWATRGHGHRVLLLVHNVTSATRLLDVLPLFHDDFRVQLLATCTGSSAFRSGVAELLADTAVPVLPWEQAVETPVSLVISASFGGQLQAFSGKLTVLSHGVGYTKRLAIPDTGYRIPDTGRREPSPLPVFGMSREWLLGEDGEPIADALVLSHPEQYERLRVACPEAAPTAVLAGDPCFDRMLAARPYRERFRRALGVRSGQRLVLLNSTWNPESLFGDGGGDDVLPSLLPRLTSELPADEYRLAAVLHPNIWHGHGPGQIRAWLDRARRAGLALVDPLEGWRQALLAADAVIGDHGSVTYYAAALGTPVLLGAAPLDGLDPDAPVYDFVREAPRLDARAALRVLTRLLGSGEVSVVRHADPRTEPEGVGEAHTAVHEDTRDPSQLALADVVFRHGSATDPRFGSPAEWTREVLARLPDCALAAYVTGPGDCTVRTRAGDLLRLTGEPSAADADPAAYASALHAWLAAGKSLDELAVQGLTVRTGPAVHRVRITPEDRQR
ncbi:hypothetical protein ACFVYG_09800 [Streptomyces sp. NPDC058256]|uniref:hypothetical protein n=1 Tax=Streptomyces sp. NPDC058256 TaxID=3346408 RepID=UPI0036E70388